MYTCGNVYECNREIEAYIRHPSGFPLIVGIDNAKDYAQLLGIVEADDGKKIIRHSDNCSKEQLANPVFSLGKLKKETEKPVVWIGAAQTMLLMGADAFNSFVAKVIDTSIAGSLIVLCPFCNGSLTLLSNSFAKFSKRIVLLHGERILPSIEVYKSSALCPSNVPADGVQALVRELEQLNRGGKIPFVCYNNSFAFRESVFTITEGLSAYRTLLGFAPEIGMYLPENCGTEKQWQELTAACRGAKAFANVCSGALGDILQLPVTFADYIENEETKFTCFAALKVFHSKGARYLNYCVRKAITPESILDNIYFAILELPIDDENFDSWLKERKKLLQMFDENPTALQDYCDHATVHGKDVLYYLSEDTDAERNALIHALCTYKYSKGDLLKILPRVAPSLAAYMQTYQFNAFNTKVVDSAEETYAFLTRYFNDYKYQKITNSQDPEFIERVEREASRRTFTKLPARSMLVKKMDKSKLKPYFFDALGVEYLAFIIAKCEELHMQADVQIAHCNLPSITSKNKDFYDMFPADSILKEEGLDELKHHGMKFDFRTTTEPVHIFEELGILSKRLKQFASMLAANKACKIVILSDHGASRLAVTYQSENKKLKLDEKGQHSGRCCPANENPGIDYATYEDGFVVLANYDRFSGSRKADVETHGGATLEETLVPIITLSAKPKEQQLFFPEETVKCSPKDGSAIKLFANPTLSAPRIVVGGNSYLGTFDGDMHNVLFTMPDIKRKGKYEAEVYDGNKKVGVLSFEAVRKTGSSNDFGF